MNTYVMTTTVLKKKKNNLDLAGYELLNTSVY